MTAQIILFAKDSSVLIHALEFVEPELSALLEIINQFALAPKDLPEIPSQDAEDSIQVKNV